MIFSRFRRGHGISLLVPFNGTDPECQRVKNWEWLKRYWKASLPGAEIVIGTDNTKPFSKSVAVNRAAEKAKGDVFVIVDADCYISAEHILECASRIRTARKAGERLWFVPYRQFYRLCPYASACVLASDPKRPYTFDCPPSPAMLQDSSAAHIGHWYGAMIQICPSDAFWTVGGWDQRFRGWGGEDHAAMRAMDTLYWPHKTLPSQVLHIWHPMRSPDGETSEFIDWRERTWAHQTCALSNAALSGRYYGANGHPARMRSLVNEGLLDLCCPINVLPQPCPWQPSC